MTIRKTATRPIDNRRLYSLQIGEVFMPRLGKHVPWEGYGERAALMLMDRRTDLVDVISQPERMRLEINGRFVFYTPDYELIFHNRAPEVWEIKGHEQLQDERVREKLVAAQLQIARAGKSFRVLNSRDISYSNDLYNTKLLRAYARLMVTDEQIASVRSAFRAQVEIPLQVLIEAASEFAIERQDLYALLYNGTLTCDWSKLISDKTLIQDGRRHENLSI